MTQRKLTVKQAAEELRMDPREFFYYAAQIGVRFYEQAFPEDQGIDFRNFLARKKDELGPVSKTPREHIESIVSVIEADLTERMRPFAQYVEGGKINMNVADAQITLTEGMITDIQRRKEYEERMCSLEIHAQRVKEATDRSKSNILETVDVRPLGTLVQNLKNDEEQAYQTKEKGVDESKIGVMFTEEQRRKLEGILDGIRDDAVCRNALHDVPDVLDVLASIAQGVQDVVADARRKEPDSGQENLDALLDVYSVEFRELWRKYQDGFGRTSFPAIASALAHTMGHRTDKHIPQMMIEVYDVMLGDYKLSPSAYGATGERYLRMGSLVDCVRDKETALLCHKFFQEMEERGYRHMQLEETTELPFPPFCDLDKSLVSVAIDLQDPSVVRDVVSFWRETVDYYEKHRFPKGFIAEIRTLEYIAGKSKSTTVTKKAMELVKRFRDVSESNRYATLSNMVLALVTLPSDQQDYVEKTVDVLLNAKTEHGRYLLAAWLENVAKATKERVEDPVTIPELVDIYTERLPKLPDAYKSEEFMGTLVTSIGKICTTTETAVAHELLDFFEDPRWATDVEATRKMVWTLGDIANRIDYSEKEHQGIRLNTKAMKDIVGILKGYAFDPKTAEVITKRLESIQMWGDFGQKREPRHRIYRLMEVYCPEVTKDQGYCSDFRQFCERYKDRPEYWPIAAEILGEVAWHAEGPETLERCLELLSEKAEQRRPHIPRALLLEAFSLAKKEGADERIPDLVDVLYTDVFSDRLEQLQKRDKRYLRKVKEEKSESVQASLERIRGCDTLSTEEMTVVENLYQTETLSVVGRAIQALNTRSRIEQGYEKKPDHEEVRECARIELDHYLVLKRHAQGGWSNIYLVIDEGETDPDFVKIAKVPKKHLSGRNVDRILSKYPSLGEALRQLALEEKRIMSKTSRTSRDESLEYRPLPQFFEFQIVEIGGVKLPVLIYEFIEGVTLDEYFKIQPEERHYYVGSVFQGAAHALRYVHQKGFRHNDIKGDNFMIGKNGRVYLLDLAFGRLEDSESTIHGVRAYTAPERLFGGSPTEASDQYGFGVMMYEKITGKRPIHFGETEEEKAEMARRVHSGEVRPDLETLRTRAHPAVTKIIEKCLAFDLKDRYASMDAVEEAIIGGAFGLKQWTLIPT